MITIHHLEDSRSQRVLWLLEELDAAYEVKRYDRDPQTGLGPKALYDIHALGKSPVIQHDDATVAETGAIFEYVLDTQDEIGKLHAPRGTEHARDLTYWLHYAEGSAMTNLLLKLVFSRLPDNAPMLAKPLVKGISSKAQSSFINPRIAEHVAYWEGALAKTGWFVGDAFSAADIMMSFPLEAAASRADMKDCPNIKAFLKRIHDRPAYKAALDRGGPYAYA